MPDLEPRRRRWPRVLGILGLCLLLVVGVAAVGLYAAYRHLNGNITSQDVSAQLGDNRPAKPAAQAQTNAPVNLLLMGSDTRDGQGKGFGQSAVFGGSARSDTTILLHLPADRKYAIAVSFPRDLYMTLPSCKRPDGTTTAPVTAKFNEAFTLGGPGCTIKTVEQMTGIYIDHYAVVDFKGFKNVITALGGVEVCMKQPVNDKYSHLVLPAGRSVVTGNQALAFVRARKTIGDGSDIGRIARQQEFLSSAYRKATSTSLLLDPVRLFKFLDASTKSLTTDPSLAKLTALRSLAQSAQGITPAKVRFVTVPWADRGDGANVVLRPAAAEQLFAAIRADAPWPTPPPPATVYDGRALTTRPSSVQVRVLNGTTTTGLARKAAAALEAQGFRIVQIASAKKSDVAVTSVSYDPRYDESGRTVAAAVTGSALAPKQGLGRTITVTVGADYQGIGKVVVPVKKKPSTTSRTAAERVCA